MISGGIKVKLPAGDVDKALSELADLQARSQILDRVVSEIDLRLPDRISIRPSDPKQS
jgi:cell division protein FtsQ